MPDHPEALRQALAALETAQSALAIEGYHPDGGTLGEIGAAIEAIRALAEKPAAEMTREQFEAEISADPYGRSVARFPENSAWPGNYRDIAVDLAWCMWKAAHRHGAAQGIAASDGAPLVCRYAQEIGLPPHACHPAVPGCDYDPDEIAARKGASPPRPLVPLTLAECRALVAAHFDHGEMCGDDLRLIRAVENHFGIGGTQGEKT